jgi:2-dehydro-3-deoxyphosphogluconate aldolase/(4S)-4-hydroxy-2-oxoglutarate aldolase
VARANSDFLIGAGTVLNAKQAEICIDAGARFLVSPGLSSEVLHAAAKHGVLAIPGAFTPTEVMAARELGADVIKIFPCASGGGPSHIKALRAPFPDCRFIPTGVTLKMRELICRRLRIGTGAELAGSRAPEKRTAQADRGCRRLPR